MWCFVCLSHCAMYKCLNCVGNYDAYVRTRAELEDAQMKKFRWEQDQISNMKEYIARFGHGSAKLARQAQSKEKTLDKMVQGGLTEKVQGDHVVRLRFTDVGKLPPPVLQFADVTFGYSPDRVLYRNVSDIPATNGSHIFCSRPRSQFASLLTVLYVPSPVWVCHAVHVS